MYLSVHKEEGGGGAQRQHCCMSSLHYCIPATPQKNHTAYTVNYWVSGLKFTGPVLMAQRAAAPFLTGKRDTFHFVSVFISP